MSAAACPYRSRRSSRAFFVSGPLYQLLATRRRTPTGWAESSEVQILSWAKDVARPAGSIRGIRSRCGQDSQTGPHGGLRAVLGPLGRSLGLCDGTGGQRSQTMGVRFGVSGFTKPPRAPTTDTLMRTGEYGPTCVGGRLGICSRAETARLAAGAVGMLWFGRGRYIGGVRA